MLSWIFGRRRRQTGISLSVILLLIGGCSCLSTVQMVVFGVPTAWMRAREVQALPRPSFSELVTLSPGTNVLVQAQIPDDVDVNEQGLALFYRETRQRSTSSAQDDNDDQRTPGGSTSWQREEPPPAQMELQFPDGEPLRVQFPQSVSFLNAQRIEQERSTANGAEVERRVVGYLPNQVLAIKGSWEGNGVLTASTCYAGSPEDYSAYVASQPGTFLFTGLFCGVVGAVALVVGALLRFIGR